ncbi:sugar ABC transporter permease [Aquabacterium sp. A7-Y]|uniref:carbohydrate ABC transporter permease n=1 Tax=Aquabacterium sp. A7-Y TaxID=1349605 RepID=UPI00223E7A37|nr:sugar ABC transporter permease [Aquabacterium sp. A7-Y]MCW7542032.1 sugar ABC transporter permease [Aquabacterium sp. A7-Y]
MDTTADALEGTAMKMPSRPRGWRLPSSLQAWLFLTPALLLLAAFTFWPVLWGSYLAFTEYKVITPPEWVGLKNFQELFEDEVFLTSLKNSLLYLLIVPFIQLGALLLAVLVNNSLPGIRFFRAAFYVPVVTSVSVVGIMWGWMYNEQGLINAVLQWLRLIQEPIGWLTDDRIALFAVMFVTMWRGLGWYMVLYLAGLQGIPREVEEAAILDGANRWQRFWRITVPMLAPTILLCSVLSTLAAMKVLEEVLILTQGGPISSTFTGLYYAYDMGIRSFNFPRALAASLVVSVFCILVAGLNFKFIRPRHR